MKKITILILSYLLSFGVQAQEQQTNLFEYGNEGNDICYRIPAIATTKNGNVISVADYRYCGGDIGFGRVSLHYRISKDNGKTWGKKKVLVEAHEGKYGPKQDNDLEAGFGDPAIVADRESNRVLVISCCGNVSYQAGTWEHHQGIARFYSNNNGKSFSKYEDISPSIYAQFKAAGVEPQAMFVGSGRIFQSRHIKIKDYYRIYAVLLVRTKTQGGLNYVIYSDDFGGSWAILGDDATPGVTSGDEPKAEELPNGSVLLSSRYWGRIFNIFNYSDIEQGEGTWCQQAISNKANNGVIEEGNACNGEIMILPVTRNADGAKIHLALQSVPQGPNGRNHVGIYYKGLSVADYAEPATFAKNWEGFHLATPMNSAYSTMTLQQDNTIGFLYEESTYKVDYTIVYKNYTLETITDGKYSLDTSRR